MELLNNQMNNTSKTPSQLLEIKRQMGRVPLIRRNDFVYSVLALLIIFGAFFLPPNGPLTKPNTVVVFLFLLLCIGWTALVFTDQQKPDLIKTITAFVLIVVIGWLYYRYVTVQWKQMIFLFFNVNIIKQAWPTLISGLGITIQIAVFSAVMSTILGLLLAVFRSFKNRVLNIFIIAYIDFFRAMPPLVLMFLIYFALPFLNITFSAVLSGILALGLNSSAYVSEIFRAGMSSIKKGQIEASAALGLNTIQTMRLVILPQAVKVILPPLVSNYVASAKDTALCSSISLIELLKAGLSEQAMLVNPSPLILAAAIYLIMFIPLTRLSSLLEVHMKARQRKIVV
jgi:polar amino acid transport system permease protein